MRIVAIALVLSACAAPGAGAQSGPAEQVGTERVTSADRANLREAPSLDARAVGQLRIGSRLEVVSRSADQEEIGGQRARWLEVVEKDVPGDEAKRGWIFGALTLPFDTARPHVAFEAITERLLEDRSAVPFETFVAMERALLDVQERHGRSASLELLRLKMVDGAGYHVFRWPPRNPTHARWVEDHREVIRYFEAGGFWEVRADALWTLAERYASTPMADELTWRAARPPSSHCEDDPTCPLSVALESVGKYLQRFPDGQYADSALIRFRDFSGIAARYACWNEETGEPRVDPAVIAHVRAVLRPVSSDAKAPILRDLELAEERCDSTKGPSRR